MKKVEAVIQGFKADEVREPLANEEIPRITLFEVKGAGSHQGTRKEYRDTRYIEDSADVKIEVVADDDEAERIAHLIINALQTGDLGDGEVIILPIEQNFRLRVGQHGHRSPNSGHDAAASYLVRNTTTFSFYLE